LRRFARPRYRLDRPASDACASDTEWDVHGSLDRVKDVSPSVRAPFERPDTECMRFAHADDVPLLLLPEDTCCRRCDCLHGTSPNAKTVGPTKTHALPSTREGCRRPVDQGAFHRCERGTCEDCSSPFPRRPPAHAAHTFSPWLGTMCFAGIASTAPGHRGEPGTACRALRCDFERTDRLYNRVGGRCFRLTLSSPRLGLTTQARHRGSVHVAFRVS
jgi:hypothetical protein